VINATGPFCDEIRKLDDPSTPAIVAPSSGVHVTLPNYYSPGSMGLLDPATSDGRVIFFLPWQGNAIAGTTDVAQDEVPQDPVPREEEITWILGEVRNYLSKDIKVRRGDVLSAWSGLRPLVRNPKAAKSEGLVRNHLITFSDSGLLTIAGGKWTTYRAMAQETVDAAIKDFSLQPKGPCVTEKLRLLGSHGWYPALFVSLIQQFGLETDVARHLSEDYGSLAWVVCSMAKATGRRWPIHGVRIDTSYPYIEAEVRYAISRELAATATDVIARRTRLAFLNAQAALEALPRVIEIMAAELKWSNKRCQQEFEQAKKFLGSMGRECFVSLLRALKVDSQSRRSFKA
jgi:glycerol-3-phosphate dehydrogenase